MVEFIRIIAIFVPNEEESILSVLSVSVIPGVLHMPTHM